MKVPSFYTPSCFTKKRNNNVRVEHLSSYTDYYYYCCWCSEKSTQNIPVPAKLNISRTHVVYARIHRVCVKYIFVEYTF